MFKIGDQLPDFITINQDGTPVNSKDLKGEKVIIFFYPKANTPTCTIEACNLNENYEDLQKMGFKIFGISADPQKNQKKFHEKYNFKYNLLIDESKEICEKFGVWQLKKMMGKEYMGIVRTTFVFNERSICIEVIEKVDSKNHVNQILERM